MKIPKLFPNIKKEKEKIYVLKISESLKWLLPPPPKKK